MEVLLKKIGQLAIFLICAQTLIHFRAKESYEKYIKLLVSLMLLILLVEPIMDLFGEKDKGTFLEQVQVYEQSLQEILTAPGLENHEIEQILQNMMQESVGESYVYLQETQSQVQNEETVRENNVIREDGGELEGELHGQEALKEGKIQLEVSNIEIEKIEEVKIGERYGKSAENP